MFVVSKRISAFAKFGRQFHKDTSGAITVDWVVLTAAIVGLAVAVIGTIVKGTEDLSADASRCLKITGNQLFNSKRVERSHEWRMARAQRNCGRL
jgi:hypothetical protein